MVPWLLELRLVRAPRAGPMARLTRGRFGRWQNQMMDQITLSPGGLERWPKPDRAAYRGAFLERSLASFSLGLTTTLLSGRKH